MKSNREDRPRPIRDMIRRLIVAPASLSFIWPVLLIVGGYVAWDRWGAEHVATQFYGVQLENIYITEPPTYVRTDITSTVFRDTALDQLSLLDVQATAKIASAFSTHPWVNRVISVRKLPGGKVDVHLDYRRPVAMVLVVKPDQSDSRNLFIPVDSSGIVLPMLEFASSEIFDYIHIEVPSVYPTGVVGGLFGDSRVEAAAGLAGILSPVREQAKVRAIGVHGDARQNNVPQLEITTTDNRRLFWGSPPGLEEGGERTVEMKLHALMSGEEITNGDLRLARRNIVQ
ncbi:cell division protein FtsQ/DivIB [Novipirellula sp. SH528]|uniref:cell division protein FtsQ/DivIB n=1 Tax=Novipirellula sp. SH528 TaxID=3454466 RepID=UPI003F9FB716